MSFFDVLGSIVNPIGAFVGNIVSDVTGASQSRLENFNNSVAQMEIQQGYALDQMFKQQEYNMQSMARQQHYAFEQMEQQNLYNIDAFYRENEYNSPVAQRGRMMAAGLNPNWVDGPGSVIADQNSSVGVNPPSGGSLGVNPPSGGSLGGSGESVGSIISAVMSLGKFKKEQELLNEQIKTEQAKQDDLRGSANEHNANANFTNLSTDDKIKQIRSLTKNLDSDTKLNLKKADLTDREIVTYFDEALSRINQNNSLSDYYQALNYECYQLVDSKMRSLDAKAKSDIAQSLYYDVLTEYEPVKVQVEQRKASAQEQANAIEQFKAQSQKIVAKATSELYHAYSNKADKEAITEKFTGFIQELDYKVRQWVYEHGADKQAIIDINRLRDRTIKWADESINRMINQNVNDKEHQWNEWQKVTSDVESQYTDLMGKIIQGIGIGSVNFGSAPVRVKGFH